MRTKHLHAEIAALHAKAKAVLDKAEAEGRGFTDDERTELETTKARIAKVEADVKQYESFAAPVAAIPDPEPVAVQVSQPNHTRDPRRGFASHREFLMSAMRLATHGAEASDERIRPPT